MNSLLIYAEVTCIMVIKFIPMSRHVKLEPGLALIHAGR
jgi:hypothetical protein